MSERIGEVPGLVRRLYGIVDDLEAIFPGRHFTPDGHLVGSLGEALAAYMFDLDLLTASTKSCDAITADDRIVEIKATQRSQVLTADPDPMPDLLLVLKLDTDGSVEVVYNGPGAPAWVEASPPQKNGQRRLSVAKLRKLDDALSGDQQIELVRPL